MGLYDDVNNATHETWALFAPIGSAKVVRLTSGEEIETVPIPSRVQPRMMCRIRKRDNADQAFDTTPPDLISSKKSSLSTFTTRKGQKPPFKAVQ